MINVIKKNLVFLNVLLFSFSAISSEKKGVREPIITSEAKQDEESSFTQFLQQIKEVAKSPLEEAQMAKEAKRAFENQEWKTAESLYLRLIELKPKNEDYRFYLGQAYMRDKRFSQAEAVFKELLEINSEHQDARLSLGHIYLFQGRFLRSERLFERVLEDQPRNVDALMGLGRAKEERKRFAEAQSLYEKALQIDPQRKEARDYLARLRQTQEKERFLEKTDQIKREHPVSRLPAAPDKEQKKAKKSSVSSLLSQTKAAFRAQDYKKTIALAHQAIQSEPQNGEAHFYLGQAYLRLQAYTLAIEAFQEALSFQPSQIDIKVSLGYAFFFDKRWKQSEKVFASILSQDPYNLEALIGLGRVKEEEKEIKEAEALYRQALRIDPYRQEIRVYLDRAIAAQKNSEKRIDTDRRIEKAKELAKQKKDEEAIEIYLLLLQEKGENGEMRFLLGQAYQRTGRYDEAIASFQKALKLNPQDLDASLALAHTYLFSGILDRSETQFYAALKLAPLSEEALIGLARVKILQKNISASKDRLKDALAINSQNETAQLLLNQLRAEEELAALKAREASAEEEKQAKERLEQEKKRPAPWAQELYAQAQEQEKEKNFAAAFCLYQRLLAAYPENADYLFKWGKTATRLKKTNEAFWAFKKTLEVNPAYHDARASLAYLYLFEDDWQRSRALFEEVLRQEPLHTEALAGMGRIAYLLHCFATAEAYFLSALGQEPNQDFALAHYSRLLLAQRRFREARSLLIRLRRLDPCEPATQRALFNGRGYTDPSLLAGAERAQEKERDRTKGSLTRGEWIARLENRLEYVEAFLPYTDNFRFSTRFTAERLKQLNLIRGFTLFDARIETYKFRAEYFYNTKWSAEVWEAVSSTSNEARHPLLPTEREDLFLPGGVLRYEDENDRMHLRAATLSLLDKDFSLQKTYLIAIKDVGFDYEHRFACRRWLIGLLGDRYWYRDRTRNCAYELSGWSQVGVKPFEEDLAIRYQTDYRRFKKEVPDYYSYRYQFTQWLALRFMHTWQENFRVEAEYGHGWRFTKGINVESPLTTSPLSDKGPVKRVFSYIDRLSFTASKTVSDWGEWKLWGNATRDSFDYRTWQIGGSAEIRF